MSLIDATIGFALCAALMTVFPAAGARIQAAVRMAIAYCKAQYMAWRDRRGSSNP